MNVHVGTARIERVEEQQLPVPFTLLTDDADFIAHRVEPLPSGFLDRASMTFRWIPLEKNCPPRRISTDVSWAAAARSAAASRWHCAVDIAPL